MLLMMMSSVQTQEEPTQHTHSHLLNFAAIISTRTHTTENKTNLATLNRKQKHNNQNTNTTTKTQTQQPRKLLQLFLFVQFSHLLVWSVQCFLFKLVLRFAYNFLLFVCLFVCVCACLCARVCLARFMSQIQT